jgi:hypothetical protein
MLVVPKLMLERKVFFSEEKKQKTFIHAASPFEVSRQHE